MVSASHHPVPVSRRGCPPDSMRNPAPRPRAGSQRVAHPLDDGRRRALLEPRRPGASSSARGPSATIRDGAVGLVGDEPVEAQVRRPRAAPTPGSRRPGRGRGRSPPAGPGERSGPFRAALAGHAAARDRGQRTDDDIQDQLGADVGVEQLAGARTSRARRGRGGAGGSDGRRGRLQLLEQRDVADDARRAELGEREVPGEVAPGVEQQRQRAAPLRGGQPSAPARPRRRPRASPAAVVATGIRGRRRRPAGSPLDRARGRCDGAPPAAVPGARSAASAAGPGDQVRARRAAASARPAGSRSSSVRMSSPRIASASGAAA